MSLDEALSEPLAPVRDDGFSVGVLLAARHAEERRRLLLWGAVFLALLPLLLLLAPLAQSAVVLMARISATPLFAYAAGALMLFWASRPRLLRL